MSIEHHYQELYDNAPGVLHRVREDQRVEVRNRTQSLKPLYDSDHPNDLQTKVKDTPPRMIARDSNAVAWQEAPISPPDMSNELVHGVEPSGPTSTGAISNLYSRDLDAAANISAGSQNQYKITRSNSIQRILHKS